MKVFDTTFQAIIAHAKNVKPAMLAVVLFLGIVFTFALKTDQLGQTTQTAMLPEVTADSTLTADSTQQED